MKKMILILIALLVIGAIFFMNKNDNTVSIQKTETEIEKPTILKEVKTVAQPIITKEEPEATLISNKPFKNNTRGVITDDVIAVDDFQKEKIDNNIVKEFKKLYPTMLEEVKKIPECLGKAETNIEAFNCSSKFEKLNIELAMIIGEYEGDNSSSDFLWNQETKEKIIEEVEKTIPLIYEQAACIKNVQNITNLEQCLGIK